MPSTLSRIRESALPRLVDQAGGTPLLWLLGACRRQRPLPAAPHRFGLMMFETIGDTLLAGTLVATLRSAFPGAEVIVFASRGNRGILDLFEGVAAVVEVPLTRPARAMAAIRSVAVDVMIDIGQWPRWYAVLCAFSRSRHTIGFATPRQARHYAYDSAVPHARDVHEIENFQRLLAPLGPLHVLPPASALKRIGPPPLRIAASQPYVVVHPWASGFRFMSREWPLERWTGLIARMCAFPVTVLISGSAADRPRAAALAAACPAGLRVKSIAGDVSLEELAAILKAASAVVAVNTGVMHLAAIVDAPLVALHGPTSRRRWGPRSEHAIALAPSSATNCEFLHLGFEYPRGPVRCMECLEVNEVFNAVRAVMAAGR
jgi:heptosyltransferase III